MFEVFTTLSDRDATAVVLMHDGMVWCHPVGEGSWMFCILCW